MGWFAQTVRSVVVFHSCTERLKEKFKIGPLNDIDVTHMNSDSGDLSGAMDVRFEAVTTEKKTQRKSHFVGVCHIGREASTRGRGSPRAGRQVAGLSAHGGGVVRRVPKADVVTPR
jgi:hypothetical protein